MNEKKNRYTRLKDIQKFGYNFNWDNLMKYRVGIVGVGGLGCVSSELVVRCGIGKLTLFDFDTVEIVNLNRHMYKLEHIGQPKVEVASRILKEINPDVEINYFNKDIMDTDFENTFEHELKQIDIILNGLDNVPARGYLNIKCIAMNTPYIDAGASRSGMYGWVHPVIPYKTACSECIYSFFNDEFDEAGESCVASLPSTMAILASMQVQEMLKFLLKFGKMIDLMAYSVLDGSLVKCTTNRDENCPVCSKKRINLNKKVKIKSNEKELKDLIKKLKRI